MEDLLVVGFQGNSCNPAPERRPRLEFGVIRCSWRFAAGDGAATLLGTAPTHGDKLLPGAFRFTLYRLFGLPRRERVHQRVAHALNVEEPVQ